MGSTSMTFSRSSNYTTQEDGDSINYNTQTYPSFGAGTSVRTVTLNIASGLTSGTSSGRTCDVCVEFLTRSNWRTVWSGSIYLSGSGTSGGYDFGTIEIPQAYRNEFGTYGISEIAITQDGDYSIRGKAGSSGTATFEYVSMPSVPGELSVSPFLWESGNVTIAWNASTVTDSSISRYYIEYRRKPYGGSYGQWKALANTTGTEYQHNPMLNKGEEIQYRVRALSSDSLYSSYTQPATVTRQTEVASNLLPAGGWYTGITQCSWTPTSGSSYCKYKYSTDEGHTWSSYVSLPAGVNSFNASAVFGNMPAKNGYQFAVVCVAANGDETSAAMSEVLYKNTAPSSPELIRPVSDNVNAYGIMHAVFRVPADADAHEKHMEYSTDGTEWTATENKLEESFVHLQITRSCTLRYKSVDQYGAASQEKTLTVSVLSDPYTDEQIIAGTTRIKAAHMTEIRARIESVCAMYGVDGTAWSEQIIAGTTSLKGFAGHVLEMRNALDGAYSALNGTGAGVILSAPQWKTVIEDCQPSAAAVMELRREVDRI